MCDHCNYKVHDSLHSIHHYLKVAHIFHTLPDLADEYVCQGVGVDTVGLQPRHVSFFKVAFSIEYSS